MVGSTPFDADQPNAHSVHARLMCCRCSICVGVCFMVGSARSTLTNNTSLIAFTMLVISVCVSCASWLFRFCLTLATQTYRIVHALLMIYICVTLRFVVGVIPFDTDQSNHPYCTCVADAVDCAGFCYVGVAIQHSGAESKTTFSEDISYPDCSMRICLNTLCLVYRLVGSNRI